MDCLLVPCSQPLELIIFLEVGSRERVNAQYCSGSSKGKASARICVEYYGGFSNEAGSSEPADITVASQVLKIILMARSFLVILHRYQVIQERSEMNENKVRSKDEATNDFDELWSIGKHSAAAQHVFGEKKTDDSSSEREREREREREMEDEGGSKREEEERAAKKAKMKAETQLKKSFRKPRTLRYTVLADPVPGQTVLGDLNVGVRDDEEDMEMNDRPEQIENVQSSSQQDITHLVPPQSSPTGGQQLSAQPLLISSSSASDAGRLITFDTDAFDQALHRFESGKSDEAKFSEPENPVHQDAQPEPCKEICVLNRQASLSWSLSDHDVSSPDEACQSKPTGQHVGLLDKSGGPESEDHAMHDGSYHSDESEQSVEGQYIGGSSGDEKSD